MDSPAECTSPDAVLGVERHRQNAEPAPPTPSEGPPSGDRPVGQRTGSKLRASNRRKLCRSWPGKVFAGPVQSVLS